MATDAQLACTYAALILYDDGQDITGDKIATLVKAAGLNIEAYWPKLFAKAVEGQNIASFFSFGGSISSGSTSGPAKTAPAAQAPKQQPKKEDKKAKKEVPPPPPKEEDEDVGMGGLFD